MGHLERDDPRAEIWLDPVVISYPGPCLHRASQEQRKTWRLIGQGDGIHWPDIDEDISTIGLTEGRPSVEYTTAKVC